MFSLLLGYSMQGLALFSSVPCETQDLVEITKQIEKQAEYRMNNWCLVFYKGEMYTANILKSYQSEIYARVFDLSLPIEKWPEILIPYSQVSKLMHDKCTTLDELILSLKQKRLLSSPKIEEAFRTINRKYFTPDYPYFDTAINVGYDSCISSPHIHSIALELSKHRFDEAKKILDVGSGSGYVTALYAHLSPNAHVYGIEYLDELTALSQSIVEEFLSEDLKERIHFLTKNGEEGLQEEGPFDLIHVGFMCHEPPAALIDQLVVGGRLLVPVGTRQSGYDERCLGGMYVVIDKLADGSIKQTELFGCSFVPSFSHPVKSGLTH